MKNVGKLFEEDFIKSVPSYMFRYRFRDLPYHLTKGAKYEVNNNPADFLIVYDKLFILELKSCAGTSLPCSNVRGNQIEGLKKYSELYNTVSGFVINYRRYDETYFLEVCDYLRITSTKASIGIQDARVFGVLITQQLKRTRFSYDIESFIKKF
ncbi:MAG: Holliday junction resolvase RecU [Cetobacterium sp.]